MILIFEGNIDYQRKPDQLIRLNNTIAVGTNTAETRRFPANSGLLAMLRITSMVISQMTLSGKSTSKLTNKTLKKLRR